MAVPTSESRQAKTSTFVTYVTAMLVTLVLFFVGYLTRMDTVLISAGHNANARAKPELNSALNVAERVAETRLRDEASMDASSDYPDADHDEEAALARTQNFQVVAELSNQVEEAEELQRTENYKAAAGSAQQSLQTAVSEAAAQLDGMQDAPKPDGEPRCDNTCEFANDGVCDDGSTVAKDVSGTTPARDIKCDLGTDCSDCGALPYAMNTRQCIENEGTESLCDHPVKYIKSMDVNLRAARTKTVPSFIQAYTDPKKDVDVSERMENKRIVEDTVVHIWRAATKKCCASGRGVVVDVGANFGMFTMLSAQMGCDVVAFEPVPLFRSFVRYGLQANALSHKVHLRPRVAAGVDGDIAEVTVPQAGIWGTAGVGGLNVDPAINDPRQFKIKVKTERVGTVMSQLYPNPSDVDLCMFKVDVEGFEPEVFDGASEIFRRYLPKNVMMEYTPGVYERSGDWKKMYRFPAMLYRLLQHDYIVRHLLLKENHVADFDGPVPSLNLIETETIMHDLRDAARMYAGEIRGMPWPLHPDSLHGHFGHNTDIWAALDHDEFGRRADEKALYMTENTPYGLAARNCNDLNRYAPQREVIGCLCQKDKDERREVLIEEKAKREKAGKKALETAPWWGPLVAEVKSEVSEANSNS